MPKRTKRGNNLRSPPKRPKTEKSDDSNGNLDIINSIYIIIIISDKKYFCQICSASFKTPAGKKSHEASFLHKMNLRKEKHPDIIAGIYFITR